MEIRIQESVVERETEAAKGRREEGDDGHCAGCGILVLDADRSAAGELEDLLMDKGCSVRAYRKLESLLNAGMPDSPSCLLLGAARNGGRSGLEMLADLRRRNWSIPIVMTAKCWTIELVVDAMRAGADGFVPRPFDSQQLKDALCQALERERPNGGTVPMCEPGSLLASLNFRELEVVRLVMRGLLNKEIADRMGLAIVTVKVYRARAMRKLGARNTVELAKIVMMLGLDTDSDDAVTPGPAPRVDS